MAKPFLRGYAGREVWYVVHVGGNQYLAERTVNGKYESHYVSAHCLACAKTHTLERYGGRVDLRGWHKAHTMCGFFLKATQQAVVEESNA